MFKTAIVLVAAAALSGCVGGGNSGTVELPRRTAWGTTSGGEEASLYELKGADGLTLVVSDFGGRLVRCFAPDRDGRMADVTLGWNTVDEYERYGFSMGTLIGRFANRINNGRFSIDGREYQLAVNEGKPPRHSNIHSGPRGWWSKVWKATPFADVDSKGRPVPGVKLELVSPDGDMGFPGEVRATVTYTVLPGNVWRLEYEAKSDAPTVINLTHHSYWNLAGEASGDMLGQELKIFADEYTTTDDALIPSGNAKVAGTGFDFREFKAVGADAKWLASRPELATMDHWYDHNFVLRGKMGELHEAAFMRDRASGRLLEVWTTEPCMQMYCAQNIGNNIAAKEKGKNLVRFAGLALETQHYPDSPNHPEFPTTVLRPGETFRSTTEYRFRTMD